MAKNHNDVWNAIRETGRNIDKLSNEFDKRLKNLSEEVGKVTKGIGNTAEGLASPAVEKLFAKLGITNTYSNLKARRNGQSMEIDLVGEGNGLVALCEVSNRLTVEEINGFLAKISKFPHLFSRYKGLKIIGVVAGVKIDDGAIGYATSNGLYVLGTSNGVMRIFNKKGFKPKYW